MFFHILEDAQVGEVKGYRRIKSLSNPERLAGFLMRQKSPVWIIYSASQYLPVNGRDNPISIGGYEVFYHQPEMYGKKEMQKMVKRPIFNEGAE